MAAELIAGAGALTSAISIAKSLVDLRDEVKRLEHVSELLRKLTAAHEAQSALINRVRELEDENVKLKDWGQKNRSMNSSNSHRARTLWRRRKRSVAESHPITFVLIAATTVRERYSTEAAIPCTAMPATNSR